MTEGLPDLDDDERVFGALAHAARRQILVLLAVKGGELPSGYIAKRFGHSWPTTSRHLRVLEEAGLVDVHREGRGSCYRLNAERLRAVVGGWLEHLTPYEPSSQAENRANLPASDKRSHP